MKFLIENGSIIVFFLCYKLFNSDMVIATAAMIISSVTLTIIGYFFKHKPSVMSYISIILLTVMGSLSIISGDTRFIKMKPTIINALFAVTLFIGCYKKVGLAKYLFNGAIEMSEKNWINFSLRFGIYFASLAILNEIIWRNFSEEFWVNFKLFGMLPISLLFMLTQVPFLLRNRVIPTE
jgi:intracellular septation protein